uniref:Putative torsin a n=1 Tax=Anopheles braziliensis TaxID=58242 RepID=A0A2M3ZE57_9DIPT
MRLQAPFWFRNFLAWCLCLSIAVEPSYAFFDLTQLTNDIRSGVQFAFEATKDHTLCQYYECCTRHYIPADINALRNSLEAYLFGQHIAKKLVVDAIGGHFQQIDKSEKPLVISFHGAPGTGKNYIAEHIANALFKKGSQSDFVHKYLGRIDFPLESKVNEYKFRLVEDIKRATAKCPTSLFIFDEVEKMPPGLFDTIVSLLDNHAYTREHNFRQSIFIFLSNVAGPEIANQLKLLLDKGTWRESTELHDFERTLEISAYNLEGGLYRSEMIESHVVDHFVPFLPLEQRHVEKCIIREYHKLTGSVNIDETLLKDILREAVTFDETGIFSNNGCKRVSKKVESFYYNRLRKAQRNEEL